MKRLVSIARDGAGWLFGGVGRVRHERWEIWMMRVCVAAMVYQATASRAPDIAKQPYPHGIARFLDLTFLSRQEVYSPLYWLFKAALVGYVLGFGVGPCLACILVFVVATNSLVLSQGFVGHAGQLAGLVLLAQFAAALWAFVGGRHRAPDRRARRGYRDDLIMDWSRQAIAACYVVAGMTKIINSDGAWISRSMFFVLQVQKVQREVFFTTGELPNQASMMFLSAIGRWPLFAAVFLTAGLLLELLAFLGAWNRPLALVFGLLLIGFHLMMGMLMYLPFYENRDFLLLFFVNPAWWTWLALRRCGSRIRGKHHVT